MAIVDGMTMVMLEAFQEHYEREQERIQYDEHEKAVLVDLFVDGLLTAEQLREQVLMRREWREGKKR